MLDLLSEDIQVQILSRLPVKSLLYIKCVCKLWCSLISDPNFIKNHLNRGILTNNYRLLVNYHNPATHPVHLMEEYTSGFASVSLTTSQSLPYDGYDSVDYPFQDTEEIDNVRILGSSNGLICLCITGITNYDKDVICVWNPSTAEYKQLPPFRMSPDFYKALYGWVDYDPVDDPHKLVNYDNDIEKSDFYGAVYGFGYDGVSDDYKLVRIDNADVSDRFYIQVYTLRSNSWSNVWRIPYSFPFPWRCDAGLFVNGALHWFGVSQETSTEAIVSFNLSNERTVEIPLPEARLLLPRRKHEKFYRKMGVNVGLLENCLCLVLIGDSRYNIDVWVMKDYGVRESWTKQFTMSQVTRFSISRHIKLWSPIWTFKNGDTLANHTMFGCLIIAENHKESIMRDPKEVEVRVACINCAGNQNVLESVSYVESLVSLGSGTYLGKRISNVNAHTMPEIGKLKRLLEFIKKLITTVSYSWVSLETTWSSWRKWMEQVAHPA